MKQKQKTQNQAGREKNKNKVAFYQPLTMWYYLSPLFQIMQKKYMLYVSVYSKVLPNLDENHDYYILHDIKNEKKRKKYYPPHVHQCLFKNLYEKNTLLFSITAFFLSLH